jgi:hypothetical protein
MSDFINIDLASAPDEIPPVAAGTYSVVIDEVPEVGTTSTQKPMITFKLRIDAPGSGEDKRIVRDNVMLDGSDIARVRLKKLFRGFGINPPATGFDPNVFVGKRASVILIQRSYRDKDTGELKMAVNVKEYVING